VGLSACPQNADYDQQMVVTTAADGALVIWEFHPAFRFQDLLVMTADFEQTEIVVQVMDHSQQARRAAILLSRA
jgi:hypothetical protein